MGLVACIAFEERHAGREVIDNRYDLTPLTEGKHSMAADVAGPTGDQDGHGAKLKATLHYLKAEAGLGDFSMEVAAGAEGP